MLGKTPVFIRLCQFRQFQLVHAGTERKVRALALLVHDEQREPRCTDVFDNAHYRLTPHTFFSTTN